MTIQHTIEEKITNNALSGEYPLKLRMQKNKTSYREPFFEKNSTLHVFPQLYDQVSDNSQYWNVDDRYTYSFSDGIITITNGSPYGAWNYHLQDFSDYLGKPVVLKALVRVTGGIDFGFGDSTSPNSFYVNSNDESNWFWLEYHFQDKLFYKNGVAQTGETALTNTNSRMYLRLYPNSTVEFANLSLSSHILEENSTIDLTACDDGTLHVLMAGEDVTASMVNVPVTATISVTKADVSGTYDLPSFGSINYMSGLVIYKDALYYQVVSSTSNDVWEKIVFDDYLSVHLSFTSTDNTKTPVISRSPYIYQLDTNAPKADIDLVLMDDVYSSGPFYPLETDYRTPALDGSSIRCGEKSINSIFRLSHFIQDEGYLSFTATPSVSGSCIGFYERIRISTTEDRIGRMIRLPIEEATNITFNWYQGRCYVYINSTFSGIVYDTSDWNNLYLFGFATYVGFPVVLSDISSDETVQNLPDWVLNPTSTPSHANPIDLVIVDKGTQTYNNKYVRCIGEYLDEYGNAATEEDIKAFIVRTAKNQTQGAFTVDNSSYDIAYSTSFTTSGTAFGVFYEVMQNTVPNTSYAVNEYENYLAIHKYNMTLDTTDYVANGGIILRKDLTVEDTITVSNISSTGCTVENVFTIPELDDMYLREGDITSWSIDGILMNTGTYHITESDGGHVTFVVDSAEFSSGEHVVKVNLSNMRYFVQAQYEFTTTFTV